MKKKILFILLLLIPFMVKASSIDETVIREKLDDDVNGSAVIAGDSIDVNKNIDGIGVLLGSKINFTSKSEFAIIAGSEVNLEGEVLKEFLVAGETVTFKNNFKGNRDGFIFANKVILSGNLSRNITVKANEVVLENVNIESINIEASKIEIKESVAINQLTYNENANVTMLDDSKIVNKTLTKSTSLELTPMQKIGSFLINYANSLVLFAALALIVPKLFERINKQNKEIDIFKFVTYAGYGILSALMILILSVLLFSVTIGVYLALLLLAFYTITALLSIIFTGYLVGYIIWTKLIKKEENYLLIGLIGISLMTILTNIPYVGVYFGMFAVLVGIGLVLNLFKKLD
ncbi:putative uncharacterized protein [Acholeplasma sp. CAG:878]|nr:putative uncharacterized protein [Acholeplasma sp. CAG:878]